MQYVMKTGYNICWGQFSPTFLLILPLTPSDVQGLVNPPRVKVRGQEGKGQGKDFMTLNKPLNLLKGQECYRGFTGVCISLISRYSRCCMSV